MTADLQAGRVTEGLNRAVLADHLRSVLAHYRIDTVLDVGAWTGGYGTMLRGLGYRGWIVSFEPVPESFAELEEAAAGDDRWRAYRIAVGDREEAAELTVASGRDMSSVLPATETGRSAVGERITPVRTEQVELRRLDSVWQDLVPPGDGGVLLKTDTQGYDWHVIDGAGDRLADVSVVQVEAPVAHLYEGMVHWLDLIARLESRGFHPTGVFPVTRDPNLRLVEVDILLAGRRQMK